MGTIIVGSNFQGTANYYKVIGLPPSNLILDIDHSYDVGHTCIQDIPDHNKLELVLSNANDVYWSHPDIKEFSSPDSYYDFLNWLKDYNLRYNNVKNIDSINFDPYGWTHLIELNENHAVFMGCSFTAGSGLSDYETHYSTIVAKHFNKDLLNLSQPGGSNQLIFERFFQCNFVPGQLVVLQFTYLERVRYCLGDKKIRNVLFSNNNSGGLDRASHKFLLEVYNKDFLFYEFLIKLKAVIKIAELNKLKLVFWLVDYKNNLIYSGLDQTYFYNMKQFLPASWIHNYFVDVAEDNTHPGIKSNINIANAIIKYVETIY